ncbi:MAG TPA: hypothetical protein VJ930_06195 [Acidimicrobiia bacterium]|nr:hypothetical protein [Acidimicrobiia bacterium]
MTIAGLRQRLENLEGVASIQLELADTGLSGIRVTLSEGADEAMVLERIRAMLVTYGLRAPDQVTGSRAEADDDSSDLVAVLSQEGDRLRVEVRGQGETVSAIVDPSPLSAARAVAAARAQLRGEPAPEVMWIGLDQIGAFSVLTILTAQPDEKVSVGSAVVEGDWAQALNRALAAASA